MQDEGFCSHGSAQAILFGPGATGCVIAMSVHPFSLNSFYPTYYCLEHPDGTDYIKKSWTVKLESFSVPNPGFPSPSWPSVLAQVLTCLHGLSSCSLVRGTANQHGSKIDGMRKTALPSP